MEKISSNDIRRKLKELGRNMVSITVANPRSEAAWFYLAVERYVGSKYQQPLNPVKKAKAIATELSKEFKVTMHDSQDGLYVLIFVLGESKARIAEFIRYLNFGGKWPLEVFQGEDQVTADMFIDNISTFKDAVEYDEDAVKAEIRAEIAERDALLQLEAERELDEEERKEVDIWLNPTIEFFNRHYTNRPIKIEYHNHDDISGDPNAMEWGIRFIFKEYKYLKTAHDFIDSDGKFYDLVMRSRAVQLDDIFDKATNAPFIPYEHDLVMANMSCLSIRQIKYIQRTLQEKVPKLTPVVLSKD